MAKHKTDSAINIVGLCVAFTSAILLLLSVYYEFSFDRFHKNSNHIYHLYMETELPEKTSVSTSMPAPIVAALKNSFPQVKHGFLQLERGALIRYGDKKLEENLKSTNADFFRMLSFPIIEGDKQNVFPSQNSVVLRQSTANAIFGKEPAIGKTIEIQNSDGWKPFTVSAIASDYPSNSSFTYDVIVPMEQEASYNSHTADWDNHYLDAYIQLDDKASKADFEKKLPAFIKQHFAESIAKLKRDGAKPDANGNLISLR